MTRRPFTRTALFSTVFLFAATGLGQNLQLETVTGGLGRAVSGAMAPGRPGEMFVVNARTGTTGSIQIVDLATGSVNPTPFLEIPNVTTASEQGLLGLVFDPGFATNGMFYVNYTTTGGGAAGQTIVERYQVSAGDPDVADPASGSLVLSIDQPRANHNGGWMDFDPDGESLYIATGDGGGGFDPDENAQNTSTLLGKLLRIDPNTTGSGYTVPVDNPFVGQAGDDEIWAYGLRNPWRNSFDRQTGDLWIADVGQNEIEEINFQPAGSNGGENYGWDFKEGNDVLKTPVPADVVDPIYTYPHADGESITGGYVYRGDLLGEPMQGRYFFGDFISKRIWSLEFDGTDVTDVMEHTSDLVPSSTEIGLISSFVEDADGELYLLTLDGTLYAIVPEPATLLLLAGGSLVALRRRR